MSWNGGNLQLKQFLNVTNHRFCSKTHRPADPSADVSPALDLHISVSWTLRESRLSWWEATALKVKQPRHAHTGSVKCQPEQCSRRSFRRHTETHINSSRDGEKVSVKDWQKGSEVTREKSHVSRSDWPHKPEKHTWHLTLRRAALLSLTVMLLSLTGSDAGNKS